MVCIYIAEVVVTKSNCRYFSELVLITIDTDQYCDVVIVHEILFYQRHIDSGVFYTTRKLVEKSTWRERYLLAIHIA